MKKHITRELRRNQTPWEAKVWNAIRNRQIQNLKFRRQVKIDRYVVDFFCPSKKLIVEIDGGDHNQQYREELDKVRQRRLENQGYKILRFWNNEVDSNLDEVVEEILQHAQPHPNPLPYGRGR